jgi:glycosyltransferase involved in cell wall biosynthesis
LAIAGRIENSVRNQFDFESTMLGYLSYEDLAKAYNAADVFVCPSIEDSGPSMINQSALCGTPIVAFEMGVAFDLVNESLRCKLYDIENLAKCIKLVLTLQPTEYKLLSEDVYKRANNFGNANVIYKEWSNLINSLQC